MASSNQNPSQLAADEDPIRALIQQYELVKLYDAQKAACLDEVVQRLQLAWERSSSDRIESTKTHQKPSKQNGLGHNEREPFIVVLIDGNEIIFRNRFLNEGDRGGRLAAQALYQGINEYAFSTLDDLPSDTKLVVRIWIDLDDFSNICLRAGIVDNANRIKSFVRGFCQDGSLFDLVDVGMHGQAVVFDKMEGENRICPDHGTSMKILMIKQKILRFMRSILAASMYSLVARMARYMAESLSPLSIAMEQRVVSPWCLACLRTDT